MAKLVGFRIVTFYQPLHFHEHQSVVLLRLKVKLHVVHSIGDLLAKVYFFLIINLLEDVDCQGLEAAVKILYAVWHAGKW